MKQLKDSISAEKCLGMNSKYRGGVISMCYALYKIFYRPVVSLAAFLVVLAGNLRCSGHGRLGYMQNRVIESIKTNFKLGEENPVW